VSATYDTAILEFCKVLRDEGCLDIVEAGYFVRNAQGKIRLAIPANEMDLQALSKKVYQRISPYAADLLESIVPLHHDQNQGDAGISVPEIVQFEDGAEIKIRVIDHRIGGRDWLSQPGEGDAAVPALVFWSLKGGVGRTTALSVLAAELSRKSHNVLIIDLDLEAPGVSEQLLSHEQRPSYGVLDYLVEDAVGGDVASVVSDIVGASTLVQGAGLIHVCPAVGQLSVDNPAGYVGKLFRSYFPAGEKRLSDRIKSLISALCEINRYDAVLIDARAGINEATAAALIGMDADVLMFGHNTPQTFSGYRFALAHLSRFVQMNGSEWRLRMKMVHAKCNARPADQARFRDSAYDLFSSWMYDGAGDFSFDVNDADAPHYPWLVLDDSNFADFDPIQSPELLTTELAQSTFGPFLSKAIDRLRLG